MTLITRTLPATAPVLLTGAEIDELRQDAVASAIAEANALREQLAAANAKLKDLEFAYDVMSTDSAAAFDENKRFSAEIERLQKENAALKAGAVPVVPVTPTPPVVIPPDPVTVKPALHNVMGITLTKDEKPSTAQDTMTKEVLQLCSKMGFTHWRALLNFEEIRSTISLPAYGRTIGMEYVADTVDSQVARLTYPQLVQYFGLLKKHGAVAVYFNDVDRADKASVMPAWIKAARAAMKEAEFAVPFIGSFTANFKREDYPGFDAYEIQTFTRSITEFNTFVKNPSEYLCLPAEHDTPLALVQQILAVTLESGRGELWTYTCHDYDGTDWRQMPDMVAAYQAFVQKWRSKHLVAA